jgi:hypothetical protein
MSIVLHLAPLLFVINTMMHIANDKSLWISSGWSMYQKETIGEHPFLCQVDMLRFGVYGAITISQRSTRL